MSAASVPKNTRTVGTASVTKGVSDVGAYRETKEIVRYPHGVEREVTLEYVDDASPECSLCEDYGEWVAPDGVVRDCPECSYG